MTKKIIIDTTLHYLNLGTSVFVLLDNNMGHLKGLHFIKEYKSTVASIAKEESKKVRYISLSNETLDSKIFKKLGYNSIIKKSNAMDTAMKLIPEVKGKGGSRPVILIIDDMASIAKMFSMMLYRKLDKIK